MTDNCARNRDSALTDSLGNGEEVAKLSWDGERVQEHPVGPPAVIAPPAASAEVPACSEKRP